MRPGAAGRTASRWWRDELRYAAELLGLSALAVAQPVLDVFGRAPDAFVFRQADATDIVLFALVVTLGPPVVLYALTAPFALIGRTARRAAHLVAASALLAAFLVLAGRSVFDAPTAVCVGLAAVGVAGFVVGYQRLPAVRSWLRFVALAAPVFAAMFLVSSPTAALLDSGSEVETSTDADGPHVVMVVLDELPLASLLDEDGQLDRGLYPNLAGLADEATWFRNTTSVAGATWHAMPSMLTGQMPVRHEAPVHDDHPDNLFTALASEYRIEASESLTRLCPSSLCEPPTLSGLPAGIRPLLGDWRRIYREMLWPSDASDPVTSYLEAMVSGPAEPGFDDIVDLEVNRPARYRHFLDVLEQLRPSSPPTFAYLHLLLPHEPWRFYPSGVEYEDVEDDPARNVFDWSGAAPAAEHGRQRHLLQAMYADELLGGILDELRETGVYDDAVVVVTSDHGVAFAPGAPIRGTAVDADLSQVREELMWVPLLVKAPGLPGGAVRDDNVLTIDVAPTIAELAGVDLGPDVDGRSLVGDAPRGDPEKPFYPVEMSPFGNVLGERLELDGRDGLAEVRRRAMAHLVPDRRDRDLRPYRIGSFGALVGEPLADLPTGEAVDDAVELVHGARLGTPVSGGAIPGLIVGRLTSDEPGLSVAVVIDGTVAATAETFDSRAGRATFLAVVPDALLSAQGNEVSFHLIDDSTGDARLRPLAWER